MLAELTGFCRQTVTLKARTAVDSYGEPTYASAVSHKARVVGKRRLVLNPQGQQVLSTHTVYFAANPAISPDDLLTLSTGDVQSTETGALQPAILSVGIYPDDLGRMTTVAYLA